MEITFDESRATGGDVISRLQEIDRIIARLHAVQAELLVEAADAEAHVDEFLLSDEWTGEQRRILIEDPIRDELACALKRSSVVMQDMIDVARLLAGPLRPTWCALRDGVITYPHVRIMVAAAERLPEEALPAFQERVLPKVVAANLARTRRVVREAEVALDADGYDRRRRQAKCTRDVWIDPGPDGLSMLYAQLATEQALAIMQTINESARDRAAAGDEKLRIGEHRADALTALVLGGDGASAGGLTAEVNVTIDLPTLLALQDGTAELAGVGPVTATVVRDLLADPDSSVTMRRLVTDPLTGELLDVGRRSYAIPRALRDFIITRDKTCRFPGCNRRADLCEIDHAIPWDEGGETSRANLGALCKRHHQLKTHGGWRITDSRPDGSCRWHSPRGHVYPVDPESG